MVSGALPVIQAAEVGGGGVDNMTNDMIATPSPLVVLYESFLNGINAIDIICYVVILKSKKFERVT